MVEKSCLLGGGNLGSTGFLTLGFLFCLNVLLLLTAGGSEFLDQNSDIIILGHIAKNILGERDIIGMEGIFY